MMCMNQCDYPGENGEPCRCQQDAVGAYQSRLKSAVIARLGGVGAISPQLFEESLQDIASSLGCNVDEGLKAKVNAILQNMPCPID